jgi:hypothetical protein
VNTLPKKLLRGLQGITDRLIEIGKCGTVINVGKTRAMRISRQPPTVQIIIYQKQLDNVEYLNYLGSMIINASCTCEMKSRMTMTKTAFNRKNTSPATWT